MYSSSTSKRLLAILFLSQSLFSAAQIAIVTLTTIVAARLSGSEGLAGLPGSTVTFTQAFAAFPIALVMGRFGRRLGLVAGYVAGVAGALVGVLSIIEGSFALMLISAGLLGVGRASGDQSRFVAGELFPASERARMIGRIVFAGTIGAVAGPALVAPSGQIMIGLGLDPDTGPWAAAALLFAVAAVLTFLLLRPDPMLVGRMITTREEAAMSEDSRQPARPLRVLLAQPMVQLAIFAMIISQTVMIALMVMTPLHMSHHDHGRDAISLVISAHTLGMFGLSALTGYWIDRFGRIPMLMAAALLMAASALLAPLAVSLFPLAIVLFLLGLGWNFGYVAGSSLLSDTLQGSERAKVQGVNDALVFFAAGLGSLGAGPLFALGDFIAVGVAGLVLTGALGAAIFWLTRQQALVKGQPVT